MKVNLQQRSNEWNEWRKGKIGSSHAPIIMGLNPWENTQKLWKQMKGLEPPKFQTEAMKRGVDLEDSVLEWVKKQRGIKFSPTCFVDEENPNLIASLDGFNEESQMLCEIKVSQSRLDRALEGDISCMDECQMQHQFMVTGLKKGLFCAHNGKEGAIIEVRRDDKFIEEMRVKELEFLEMYQSDTLPPSETDYLAIQIDETQKSLIEGYLKAETLTKLYDHEKNIYKNKVVDLGDDGNCVFIYNDLPILKIQRINREGNVDWKALCKSKGITEDEISKFRKPQIGYSQLKAL